MKVVWENRTATITEDDPRAGRRTSARTNDSPNTTQDGLEFG